MRFANIALTVAVFLATVYTKTFMSNLVLILIVNIHPTVPRNQADLDSFAQNCFSYQDCGI